MNKARLDELRKKALERAANFNALMLASIKGHIGVEQAMDAFLEASFADPEQIPRTRFTFSHKIALCRALSSEKEEHLWNVIGGLNRLRNSMAHGEPEAKQAEAMRTVKGTYLAWLSPQQREEVKKLKDEQVVDGACGTCAGMLFTWADRAKGGG